MVKIHEIELDDFYAIKRPYNGSAETGGDALVQDLNVWYNVGTRTPFLSFRKARRKKHLG